jgi:hypothetical protein
MVFATVQHKNERNANMDHSRHDGEPQVDKLYESRARASRVIQNGNTPAQGYTSPFLERGTWFAIVVLPIVSSLGSCC